MLALSEKAYVIIFITSLVAWLVQGQVAVSKEASILINHFHVF